MKAPQMQKFAEFQGFLKKIIIKKVHHTECDCPGTPVLLYINYCLKKYIL